jgi:hypothetical protein
MIRALNRINWLSKTAGWLRERAHETTFNRTEAGAPRVTLTTNPPTK